MLFVNKNGEFKFNHLYVTQEGNHYSIRYVNEDEDEIGTYYSEDNEVIIHRKTGGPKLVDLVGEGEIGGRFLTALINGLSKGNVDVDMDPQINRNELILVLEKKRSEVLESN